MTTTAKILVWSDSAEVTIDTATQADAQALAATFAKSVRASATHVSTAAGSHGRVYISASLAPTDDNPVNEAGIRRLRSAYRTIRAGGFEVTFNAGPHRPAALPEIEALALIGLDTTAVSA